MLLRLLLLACVYFFLWALFYICNMFIWCVYHFYPRRIYIKTASLFLQFNMLGNQIQRFSAFFIYMKWFCRTRCSTYLPTREIKLSEWRRMWRTCMRNEIASQHRNEWTNIFQFYVITTLLIANNQNDYTLFLDKSGCIFAWNKNVMRFMLWRWHGLGLFVHAST